MKLQGSSVVIKKNIVGGRVVYSHIRNGGALRLVMHHELGRRVVASRSGGGISASESVDDSGLPDLRASGSKHSKKHHQSERHAQSDHAHSHQRSGRYGHHAGAGTDDADDLLTQMQASFKAAAGRRVVKMGGRR